LLQVQGALAAAWKVSEDGHARMANHDIVTSAIDVVDNKMMLKLDSFGQSDAQNNGQNQKQKAKTETKGKNRNKAANE
jgi:hypothetical protein